MAATEAPAQRERPAGAGFGGKAAPAKGEDSAPQPPKTLADFTAADGTVDLEAMEAAGLYSSKLQVDEAALADEDDEDDFENVFFNADGTPMSAAKLDALRAYDPDEASAALAAALAEGAPAGVDDGAEEGDDGLVWGAEESADETEVVVDEVSELSGDTSTESEEDEGDAYKVVDEDGNEYWFDAAGNMVGGEFDLGGDEDEDGEDAPDVFADARDEVVVEVEEAAAPAKANPWDVEFDPDEEEAGDEEGWTDVIVSDADASTSGEQVVESDTGFSPPAGQQELYRVGRGWAQGTSSLANDFEEDLPAAGRDYVAGLSLQVEGAMKTRQSRALRRERKAARRAAAQSVDVSEGGLNPENVKNASQRVADASAKGSLRTMYGEGAVAVANAAAMTPAELATRAAAGDQASSAAADTDLAPPKRKVLKLMKIAGGCRTNMKLFSPDGDGTRPMMEKVRVAMFQMIASHMDSPMGVGALPGGRWMDLYAGTGAIGLEAISRGADAAHFCELDPWVVSKCLRRNVQKARFEDSATLHTMRVEDLLRRAQSYPSAFGGSFEYMTVCPPYEKCSYPELFELLENTPLLTDDSYVVVEYPGRLRRHVPDTLRDGALEKFRDRRYGRTWLAIWGPAGLARRIDGDDIDPTSKKFQPRATYTNWDAAGDKEAAFAALSDTDFGSESDDEYSDREYDSDFEDASPRSGGRAARLRGDGDGARGEDGAPRSGGRAARLRDDGAWGGEPIIEG